MFRPSADAIEIIMQRERMPCTGAYETTKPTPLSMDEPYAHVL